MPGENQFYSAGATCFHLGATQCHPCKNPLYYNCLHLLSPRIAIDASYIKQKTMEENQNEEEVLLVADKNDDGKLKAVDKSAAKEGIWRLLLPSMENLDDFLKVNKQSSILEDFFLNFRHQYQQPTDFPFYRIPASLLDTLDVFTDMLRHPEDNKAFIDLYKINPNDYPILAQEQESPSETEQQAQPLAFESRVDWEQLARLGITRQSLEQGGDLSAVLSGGKSGLVTISTEIEGIPITTQGRIHFQEGADGKLDLKIDCYRREAALDLPFHGVLLDKETRDNILATGNAGHPVLLPVGRRRPQALPRFTGQVDQQPRRRSGGRHPYPDGDQGRHPHPGATPPALRRRQSTDRGHGLAVEKQVRRLHAVQRSQRKVRLQLRRAGQEPLQENGTAAKGIRRTVAGQRTVPGQCTDRRRQILCPQKAARQGTHPRTAGEIRQDGDYLRHRHERPRRATVQCLCPHEPRPGQARLLPLQSRQSQKSGKGNHPHSRPQDTGSGEQRCNRRSHQACATTAETGGGTTGASRSRQAGGKERSEEKERQRKKIIKT